MRPDDAAEILALEEALTRAIIANDPTAIARFLGEEWILIGADGGLVDRAKFLLVIGSSDFTHSWMNFDDWRIRTYDDAAVATAHAVAAGTSRGRPFHFEQRSTDFLVRRDGRWVCVLTQLTTISRPPQPRD